MDFIIGIVLIIIMIFIIYNFASISMSNTPNGGKCNQNNLMSSMKSNGWNTPQPISSSSLVSSSQPIYDYHKYFFIP